MNHKSLENYILDLLFIQTIRYIPKYFIIFIPYTILYFHKFPFCYIFSFCIFCSSSFMVVQMKTILLANIFLSIYLSLN